MTNVLMFILFVAVTYPMFLAGTFVVTSIGHLVSFNFPVFKDRPYWKRIFQVAGQIWFVCLLLFGSVLLCCLPDIIMKAFG